jgi:hypothetical protein
MLRKLAFVLLSGTLLGGGLAVVPALPASASIPNCADSDYQCGYLHGFADGRVAMVNGLCGSPEHKSRAREVSSDLGYRRAFEHFCPA